MEWISPRFMKVLFFFATFLLGGWSQAYASRLPEDPAACAVQLLYKPLDSSSSSSPTALARVAGDMAQNPENMAAFLSALKETGLYSEADLVAVRAGANLAPLLQSRVIHDAMAAVFSQYGYSTPSQIHSVFEHLRARSLPAEEVSALLDEVIRRLPTDLPLPSLSNLAQVDAARHRYGLSAEQYAALSRALNRSDAEGRQQLHSALLWQMIHGDRGFVSDVMARRSWWRRALAFVVERTGGRRPSDGEPSMGVPADGEPEWVTLARSLGNIERMAYLESRYGLKEESPLSDGELYQLMDLLPILNHDLEVLYRVLDRVGTISDLPRFEALWPALESMIKRSYKFDGLTPNYRARAFDIFHRRWVAARDRARKQQRASSRRRSTGTGGVISGATGVRVRVENPGQGDSSHQGILPDESHNTSTNPGRQGSRGR